MRALHCGNAVFFSQACLRLKTLRYQPHDLKKGTSSPMYAHEWRASLVRDPGVWDKAVDQIREPACPVIFENLVARPPASGRIRLKPGQNPAQECGDERVLIPC
jgi:hypothetical protein